MIDGQSNLFFSLKGGLHIGEDFISCAILTASEAKPRLQSYRVVRIPENTVRPSPIEPNILNLEAVRNALAEFRKSLKKAGSVALSFSDQSARMLLLEVKKNFPSSGELNRLIKWNMEQRFLTHLGDCRFSSQLLRKSDDGMKGGQFFFLCAAVLTNILGQYESLVNETGIEPTMISNPLFLTFNLFHDLIKKTSPEGNYIFLNFQESAFSLMVFEEGTPRYIRTISFGFSIERSRVEGHPENGEKVFAKVLAEIENLFHYHFHRADPGKKIPFFISGLQHPERIPEFPQETFSLQRIPLDLSMALDFAQMAEIEYTEHAALLPAVAAAKGALI